MEMYRKRGGRIKTITSGEGSWERREGGRERKNVCESSRGAYTCVCRGPASCFIPCTPYISCASFLHKNGSYITSCGIHEQSQVRRKK